MFRILKLIKLLFKNPKAINRNTLEENYKLLASTLLRCLCIKDYCCISGGSAYVLKDAMWVLDVKRPLLIPYHFTLSFADHTRHQYWSNTLVVA